MEKNLKTLENSIEKEIEGCEDAILSAEWDENNYKTLLNLCKLLKEYRTTLRHIKEHKRGFI